MKKIIISPYSKKLRTGGTNPKNYPYWDVLIALLHDNGWEVHQVSVEGEKLLEGVKMLLPKMKIKGLHTILTDYEFFISVDNFFHHMCAYYEYPGFVLFSQSDPSIFGYDIHTNIYKDKKYFRKDQFHIWEQAVYNTEAYLEPEHIIKIINKTRAT